VIQSILPESVTSHGTATINITGEFFGSTPGTVAIGATIGTGVACNVTSWTDTLIMCDPAAPAINAAQTGIFAFVTNSGAKASEGYSFSYANPSISDISPSNGVVTGGTNVTITGESFGSWSRAVYFGSTEATILGVELNPVNSKIVVSSPAGVGNAAVKVTVISQDSTTDKTFAYDAPSVSFAIPTSISTSGQAITVFGSNLGDGSLPSSSVTVSINGAACSPSFANFSTIVCDAPAGFLGASTLTVAVPAAGTSDSIAVSYTAPSVSSISGCPSKFNSTLWNCDASENHVLTITGSNFGPAGSENDGTEALTVKVGGVACNSVSITTPHTALQCNLPAGFGWYVPVVVSRGSRDSAVTSFAQRISYVGPSITAGSLHLESTPGVTGDITATSTSGGEVVVLNGRFDGLTAANTKVVYGITRSTNSSGFDPSSGTYDCAVLGGSTTSQIRCQLSDGIGAGLRFQVFVSNMASPLGTDTLSYPTPIITATSLRLSGESGRSHVVAASSLGDILVFNGQHFGQNPALCNPIVSVGAYPCLVDTANSNDTQIQCTTTAATSSSRQKLFFSFTNGFGAFTRSSTSSDVFSYPSAPTISSVIGCVTSGSATVDCPTTAIDSAGNSIRLTITGDFFGYGIQVSVGAHKCTDVQPDSTSPSTTMTCLLPSGTGLSRQVLLSQNADRSALETSSELVSYGLASVASISGCVGNGGRWPSACPRSGSITITVNGINFGPSGARVIVGTRVCANVQHSSASTNASNHVLTCQLPEGSGTSRAVVVIQATGALSSPSGELSYLACPSGTRISGATSCASCTPGTFANVEGQTGCVDCAVGEFTDVYNATDCTKCNPGSFQNTTGSTECHLCPKGRFSSQFGQQACESCPSGSFSNTTGLSACFPCPATKFGNSTAAEECYSCPPGRASSEPGRASCTLCLPGYYQSAYGQSECIACEPGSFSAGQGNIACQPCVAGTISSLNASQECSPCSVGEYQNLPGQISCRACAPGNFSSVKGQIECATCEAGRFSSGSASECTACSPGQYQNLPGQASCVACPAGNYSATAGRASCPACAAGSYTALNSSQECIRCSAGEFQDLEGQLGCRPCASGKYTSAKGQIECTTCEPGRFSSGSASECTACSPGQYQNLPGQASCVACPAGNYSTTAGSASCPPCAAGSYTTLNSSQVCIRCSAGEFQDLEGQLGCRPCASGTAATGKGQIECATCEPGRFSSGSASECTACSPGQYQNLPGQTSCIPCPAGNYSATAGRASCPPCAAGSYAALNSSQECIRCSAGEFQDLEGQLGCHPCASGTVATGKGQIECATCVQGRFALASASQCTACPPGQYQNLPGNDTCVACPPGKFSPTAGSTSCELCNAGKFSTGNQPRCTDCAQNAFSGPGASVCEVCQGANFISGTDGQSCICAVGYYQTRISGDCVECPKGARCVVPGVTWENIENEEGWWRPSLEDLTFYRCLVVDHCVGGLPSSSTLNTSAATCGQNRIGPICAVCQDGFRAVTSTSDCTSCPDTGPSVLISAFIFFGLAGALFFMYWVVLRSDRTLNGLVNPQDGENADQMVGDDDEEEVWEAYDIELDDVGGDTADLSGSSSAATIKTKDPRLPGEMNNGPIVGMESRAHPNFTYKLKILVGFFQVTANLAFAVEVPWPSGYRDFMSVFSFITMDFVPWQSVGCVALLDYYQKLLVVCLTPLALMVILLFFYLLPSYICDKHDMRDDDSFRRLRRHSRRKFWKLVIFTLFLMYPQVSAACVRFFVCRKIDGTWYLIGDFSLICYDGRWNKYLYFAASMVFIYPVLVPAAFFAILWLNRGRLREPSTRIRYGLLYEAYRDEYWWFEMTDMMYKLTLTSLLGFAPVEWQMRGALTVVVLYSFTILFLMPYVRRQDDRLHLFANLEIFLILLAGYILVDMDQEEKTLSTSSDILLSTLLIAMTVFVIVLFTLMTFVAARKMYRERRRRKKMEAHARGDDDIIDEQPMHLSVKQNASGRLILSNQGHDVGVIDSSSGDGVSSVIVPKRSRTTGQQTGAAHYKMNPLFLQRMEQEAEQNGGAGAGSGANAANAGNVDEVELASVPLHQPHSRGRSQSQTDREQHAAAIASAAAMRQPRMSIDMRDQALSIPDVHSIHDSVDGSDAGDDDERNLL
jgi:IPT/TIG domain/Transient receptor potential (TRP) ion channel/Tyrosine-protein kinase ephrin type A/B receptor-like